MTRWPFRCVIIFCLMLAVLPPAISVRAAPSPPVEENLQAWLDAQPGALKAYRDDNRSAAEIIEGASTYYGLSPRILLALLEATGSLLSDEHPPLRVLQKPFGTSGPSGFANQIDWAAREMRAGLGPYERPPVVQFTDGTTLTLTLQQAPEGVAVQRFLATDRTQPEWRSVIDRFGQAFQLYFDNTLPEQGGDQPAAQEGFLQRPWRKGTRVVHLAYFDHMFPTVDTGRDDNGYVVNYMGRGSVQYDGHDAHDFYFPDKPIGTFILAAADGIARASTHRGNGVWIEHANGYVTVYWHLDRFSSIFRGLVNTGKGVPVKAGDLLGSSGKTGFVQGTPHLHFEVRHNGKQVDPYGWYGAGDDPCSAYVACEPSVWLWSPELTGEFDFTPPDAAARPDHKPPVGTLTVEPRDDLLFLTRLNGTALQQVGVGTPTLDGGPSYVKAKFGRALLLSGSDGLSYPTEGNVLTDTGTIAFWAQLPDSYAKGGNGRAYLLAASAHPDDGPVYSDTLALRHESGDTPRWNFWTSPASGDAGRSDLIAPDTQGAGMHHFAITWSRAERKKALYIDGQPIASASNVELPDDIGAALQIGRWAPGSSSGGVAFDEIAIFSRPLPASEIASLAAAQTPLYSSQGRVSDPNVWLDLNALDEAGAIMSTQLGVNGDFGDPQPFVDSYRLELPASTGVYTVGARFFDRAGNSTTVSSTIELVAPLQSSDVLSSTSGTSPTLAAARAAMPSGQIPWNWPVSRLRAAYSQPQPHDARLPSLIYMPLIMR